jgi:HD-GYP domain-containing protein (c-di-GMP phosphodiesterase class II)
MKFPALKKEIHILLVRRITAVSFLAILLVVAAVCYLEIRKIENTLLGNAEKEALLFLPLLIEQSHNGTAQQTAEPATEFSEAVSQTSFLDARLLTPAKTVFFEYSRVGTPEPAQVPVAGADGLVFANEPDGTWTFAGKELLLDAVIPLKTGPDETLVGYVAGRYQSAQADTRAIAVRILLSCLIGVGGVVLCALLMYPGLVLLHNRLIINSADLNRANNFLLKKLGSALAKSDVGTLNHNYRVIIYSVRLAEKLKLNRAQIRSLIKGVFLHDIGLLDLDREMLMKPAPLDKKERKRMQEHVKRGVALIKPYRWLKDTRNLIRCHHEKYDGSGYPAGLSHDKIALEARIFAIVDAFDALTSDRPYRPARDLKSVIETLELESGAHFDPVLLAPFIEMAPQLLEIVGKLDGQRLDREVNGVLKKYIKL